MQVNLDFLTLTIGIAIILGLFVSVLILTIKKKHKLPNILLAFILMACSISIAGGVIYQSNIYRYLPHLSRLNEPVRFLVAPLFYFYTLTLTNSKLKWRRSMILHFIPFTLNVVWLIPFYIQSANQKIRFIDDNFYTYQTNHTIFWVIILTQFVFYIYHVKKVVKSFEIQIKDNFSAIDKINLSWLNTLINIILLVCFCFLVIICLSFFVHLNDHCFRPIPYIISLILLFFVFKALRQPQLINDLNEDTKCRPKYEKSNLTTEEAENYLQKINRYMENQKPYLEPELTLQQLSEELQIPVRHLSQVINEKTGSNFYSFINSYRVETMKKQLANPVLKDKSILDLAFEAGFNSKATFNAVFKQFTGLTPRQFRQEYCKLPVY